MNDEPVWLRRDTVVLLHDTSIDLYGGASGVRDDGLLDSALGRGMQIAAYEPDADIFQLAAAYASGIAKNHPFVDGNKRTAFASAATFLELNGVSLSLAHEDVVETMVALASGGTTETQFAEWLRAHTAPTE